MCRYFFSGLCIIWSGSGRCTKAISLSIRCLKWRVFLCLKLSIDVLCLHHVISMSATCIIQIVIGCRPNSCSESSRSMAKLNPYVICCGLPLKQAIGSITRCQICDFNTTAKRTHADRQISTVFFWVPPILAQIVIQFDWKVQQNARMSSSFNSFTKNYFLKIPDSFFPNNLFMTTCTRIFHTCKKNVSGWRESLHDLRCNELKKIAMNHLMKIEMMTFTYDDVACKFHSTCVNHFTTIT